LPAERLAAHFGQMDVNAVFNAIAARDLSRVGELLSASSVDEIESFSEERRRVRSAKPKWIAQLQVTALELASGSSQSDIVRLLLEFGVDTTPKCVRWPDFLGLAPVIGLLGVVLGFKQSKSPLLTGFTSSSVYE
jgi:hypothetical protein